MLGSIFRKVSKSKVINERGTRTQSVGQFVAGLCAFVLVGAALPAHAQEMETFDPNAAFETVERDTARTADEAGSRAGSSAGTIDGDMARDMPRDMAGERAGERATGEYRTAPALGSGVNTAEGWDNSAQGDDWGQSWGPDTQTDQVQGSQAPVPQTPAPAYAVAQEETYGEDDLIGAAEGVFGKGAKGLAGLIEDLLRKQGEPNGYIVGREAGGAFIFGARYGSGTLHHKIEGERKVYWTGPSLGFDAGANAGNTFVLVYNLYDSEDIFRRYPAGEGQAYLVGGLHASYMRRGDVVLIPIRVGAGLRLGVNAGYMRFSKKQRWLPF